ncbi:hypothetical protein LCGC14_1143560 [marine sediment metagenome]|uniref:Uncharacterized protein n=1 Tax=marine sediment metagenome TaxID=412755 RepID=A0A0F9M2F8_9ZZZZ
MAKITSIIPIENGEPKEITASYDLRPKIIKDYEQKIQKFKEIALKEVPQLEILIKLITKLQQQYPQIVKRFYINSNTLYVKCDVHNFADASPIIKEFEKLEYTIYELKDCNITMIRRFWMTKESHNLGVHFELKLSEDTDCRVVIVGYEEVLKPRPIYKIVCNQYEADMHTAIYPLEWRQYCPVSIVHVVKDGVCLICKGE